MARCEFAISNRTFFLQFSDGELYYHVWDDHWIFWVGPFIGAAIAALYHQYVLRASATKFGSSASFGSR